MRTTLLFLIIISSAFRVSAQYTLQSPDINVDANGIITGCNIADFNTEAYAFGNIIIPPVITIDGVDVNITGIGDNNVFQSKGITEVSIPEGVTIIGYYAFQGNSITSVSIPQGVTTIGASAFRNNQLTEVTIPESMRNIRGRAFESNKLLSVTIPDSVTYIGESAFTQNQLSEINIPKGIRAIYPYTFSNNQLTKITIPENVKYIYEYAFRVNQLTEITIPGSVDFIRSYAFLDNKISNISIPDDVSLNAAAFNINAITEVNGKASNGIIYSRTSSGIDSSTIVSYGGVASDIDFIPSNVTTIGSSAFQHNNLTSVTIPESVTLINSYAFDNTTLSSLNLPAGYNEEHNQYRWWTNGNGETIAADSEGNYSVSNFSDTYTSKKAYILQIGDIELDVNGSITSCNITDFDTEEYCNGILIIPETIDKNGEEITIKTIGANVFASRNLKYVTLPEGLMSLGVGAFSSNNKLTSLYLPKHSSTPLFAGWEDGNGNDVGVDSEGNYIASDLTTSYTAREMAPYTLTADDIVVNEIGQIYGCSVSNFNLEQYSYGRIIIPETIVVDGEIITITGISDNDVFASNGIYSVTLPESVTYIGSNAFTSNFLDQITIPENVTYIGPDAFSSNLISSFILPSHAESPAFTGWINSDGENIESNSDGIFNVSDFSTSYRALIPYTLTANDIEVDEDGLITHYYLSNKPIIIIPETITKDGKEVTIKGVRNEAFYHKDLYHITLPESIIYIEAYALGWNNFSSITLPSHTGTSDFKGWINDNYESIEPDSAGNYTASPYSSYYALVPYTLTADNIEVDERGYINKYNVGGYYKPIIAIPQSITDGVEISITGISDDAVFSEENLFEVIIPTGVTEIGDEAFYNNRISSVTLPEGLTKIKYGAFGYNNLDSVSIPGSVTYIEDDAFYRNNFTSISLPKHSELPDFEGWLNGRGETIEPDTDGYYLVTNLQTSYTVLIPYTLTADDIEVDENGYIVKCSVSNKPIIIIPETINKDGIEITIKGISIKDYDWEGSFFSSEIKKVTLPETLTYIGNESFYDNYIENIKIPESVTYIGSNAFEENELTSVTIPEGVTYIGNFAFADNDLTNIVIPEKVTYIGANAFNYNNLSSFILPQHTGTPGFIGWVNGNGETIVPDVDGNYIADNLALSYTVLLKPDAPTIAAKTDTSIKLNSIDGGEYSIDNGTTWQDTVLFSGLESAQLYSFVQRYAKTNLLPASLTSDSTTVTTDKAQQTAPAAPTLASKTYNKIVLNELEGCEYSIDTGKTWQSFALFAGLESDTDYSFVQRYVETETHYTSSASEALVVTTEILPENALTGTVVIVGTLLYDSLLNSQVQSANSDNINYQWKRNDSNIDGANESDYRLTTEDVGTHIWVEVTATDKTGSISSAPTAAIQKADQSTPDQPVTETVTYNSILLQSITGGEYSIDNGASWQSEVLFENLEINTSYSVVQRYAETATHNASPVSNYLMVLTKKMERSYLAPPTMASSTPNSITLNLVEGCEYNMNDGDWQTSLVFNGLESNTAYNFSQRYPETDTSYVKTSDVAIFNTLPKADQLAPVPPTMAAYTDSSITLNVVAACEYSIDEGANWQDTVLFNGLQSGTSYTFVQRYAETDIANASPASGPLTVATDKASPEAPAAPTLASKTATSITLNATAGCEYSNDNGASWQNEVLFGGLDINTSYNFVQRLAETSTQYASAVSGVLTVTTNKATQTAPAAPTLASKTATSITLNAVTGCEYSINGGTSWQSEVLFSRLASGTAYTLIQRLAETSTYLASPASASLAVTTNKATQTAPAAPTLASKTSTSITLKAVSGCEYSINGGTSWQSAVLFSGLEINSTYNFVQRLAETGTNLASPASASLAVTTNKAEQAAPAAPTLASKTFSSIILDILEGCEYSIDGGETWQDSVVFSGLESSTTYSLVIRFAETATKYASPASAVLTVTTEKAEQAAPAAPTLVSKTDSSIILYAHEGAEYSIDGGATWQDSVVFSGLESSTSYTLIQRLAETESFNASPASESLTVTTDVKTGIGDYETVSIKMYPNPAVNEVRISNAKLGGQLIIYNIGGGKVLQTVITDQLHRVDISSLKSGVYLVQVDNTTQRLVVQKN